MDLYPHRGLSFVRGEGAYLFTRDGTRYLDLMTNYGAALLGHAHPVVTQALVTQLSRLPTLHGSFTNDVRLRASRALVDRLGWDGAQVCWSNSGTEAIEAALKFATLATGRRRLVACEGGFHGKTLGALAVTHGPKYREPFAPLLADCTHVPYGSADAIARAIGRETAAVVVEPIQGEGGIVVPPEGYLRAVRSLCDASGALLILDEIQTGCGRTGTFLASEPDGVVPDLLCLGKGLAGGVPVGATVVQPTVARAVGRGVHTSTFGGNPLACAGVIAVLSLISPEHLAEVTRVGDAFRHRLAAVRGAAGEVRGRGLMVGVAVGDARDPLLKGLQREQVLAIPAGPDVVRFLPPLVVEAEQLEAAAEAVGRVLDGLARGQVYPVTRDSCHD